MSTPQIDFAKSGGLVPAIIQDHRTGEVLMLGYMNVDALAQTQASGWVHFWSRSKQRIWMKGEESDNRLAVKAIIADCDADTLLIKAELHGTAVCHTGHHSCFFTELKD
jgi:phosphoribosyl-AMP cyclohydrolase